jgi:protein N-terminal methyltransferase
MFKLKPAPAKNRCLDCGAGIGRVSKNLLMNHFAIVDLLEQDERFCEKARENLSISGRLGEVFNVGLQDFTQDKHFYDVIWCQWTLIYLQEHDLIEFFKRTSAMLNKNGMIIVKENFTKGDEPIFDKDDSSVTRTLKIFKNIVKKSNLRIVKEMKQNNFPKALFPVYMFALKPSK